MEQTHTVLILHIQTHLYTNMYINLLHRPTPFLNPEWIRRLNRTIHVSLEEFHYARVGQQLHQIFVSFCFHMPIGSYTMSCCFDSVSGLQFDVPYNF